MRERLEKTAELAHTNLSKARSARKVGTKTRLAADSFRLGIRYWSYFQHELIGVG